MWVVRAGLEQVWLGGGERGKVETWKEESVQPPSIPIHSDTIQLPLAGSMGARPKGGNGTAVYQPAAPVVQMPGTVSFC